MRTSFDWSSGRLLEPAAFACRRSIDRPFCLSQADRRAVREVAGQERVRHYVETDGEVDTLAGAETLIRPYKGEASRYSIAEPRGDRGCDLHPLRRPAPSRERDRGVPAVLPVPG
jgi:hypothetical protein